MPRDLHLKFRPKRLEDVLGQEPVVKSLERMIEKGDCHSVIMTGPSGVGKTTIARILARRWGCSKGNLIEIDAATNNGVDDMREVTKGMGYAALGESPIRVYVVDEAHSLSKPAWQSLLKSIEEPPEHVYWVLCTTDGFKIPETIRTRCACYDLKPVKAEAIFKLLKSVADEEHLRVGEDVLYLIAEKCQGSVRRALTGLAVCGACKSRKEAAGLLQAAVDDGEVVDLCRALMKGEKRWDKLMELLQPLNELNAESIRMVVVAYFTKVAMGAKSVERVAPLLNILDAFSDPYPTGATMYPVILSLGRVVCDGE